VKLAYDVVLLAKEETVLTETSIYYGMEMNAVKRAKVMRI
jgi:hypothetical protein